ncbi:primosomal protein N' [Oscillospiraceae bacterium OttesenSCG-928-G22]|nr:primosomal protein N' [Oscillospiraceae bacterium OttesenSCG-928-G22]
MENQVALVAVAAAPYTTDKPFSYRVPETLKGQVVSGMRVIVPFGRGNRKSEGMVLSVADGDDAKKLKPIQSLLDDRPVLKPDLLKLAIWLRERTFCTLYEVIKAMLPTGLFYRFAVSYSIDTTALFREPAPAETVVFDLLSAGKAMTLSELSAAAGRDVSKLVRALSREGILREEMRAVRGVLDSSVSMVSLALPPDETAEYIEKTKRKAPAGAAVLSFLLEAGTVSEGEILYYTGVTKAAVTRLQKLGLLEVEAVETFRRPAEIPAERSKPSELNDEQRAAAEGLTALLDEKEPKAALLYGVTGSGKTEVYLRLVEETLARGRTAMVLVPEIVLTPQLLDIFTRRFGERTAILHSKLSVGQRYDEWKRIFAGEADVVLGTRLAVFAPLSNIGLIVLDEEQENSYKSESAPRYHARDVAKYRAGKSKALLLLGSATPSVETMHKADEGAYSLFRLDTRFAGRPLPATTLVDMASELRAGNARGISRELRDALADNINRGEQSILFINRRGRNRQVVCGECGHIPKCVNCSVSLVYHSANGRLMCHYCGHSVPLYEDCPVCGGILKPAGEGTQKCEEDVNALFPGVRTLRMDADTTAHRRSHEEILATFREEKVPVLIGTQMVVKGLDFPNVTLVGVLAADHSLYADDYRANERTFSIVTQVIGRAGRGARPGRAIVQTFEPRHPVIRGAISQDYFAFYRDEIAIRQKLRYPPFCDFLVVTVSGLNENGTYVAAKDTKAALLALLSERGAQVLGPVEAAVFKKAGRYRYRIVARCTADRGLYEAVAYLLRRFKKDKTLKAYQIIADINPVEV